MTRPLLFILACILVAAVIGFGILTHMGVLP